MERKRKLNARLLILEFRGWKPGNREHIESSLEMRRKPEDGYDQFVCFMVEGR